MRYCKDCKHAERDTQGSLVPFPRCNVSPTLRVDLVTGGQAGGMCESERASKEDGRCGPEGKNFEPSA